MFHTPILQLLIRINRVGILKYHHYQRSSVARNERAKRRGGNLGKACKKRIGIGWPAFLTKVITAEIIALTKN